MGCFKVFLAGQDDYEVSYRGLKFWTKSDDETFEFFLGKIRNNEGMVKFDAKANDVFQAITPETLSWMQKQGYGLDFYDIQRRMLRTNTDVFYISRAQKQHVVIGRLGTDEFEDFMRFQKLSVRKKTTELDKIVAEKLRSPMVFKQRSSEQLLGEVIPVSKRGLAPDYNDLSMEPFLYAGDVRNAQIKITMSGNISEDFRRAFIAADIDMTDPTLEYFVWHHLDDLHFDKEGLPVCTMQFINKAFHKQITLKSLGGLIQEPWDTLIVGRHIGSVSLFENAYNVYYK